MPATKRNLDFTNVKEQGEFNPKPKPEGDYRAKIIKVEDSNSKTGNEMWVFTVVLEDDPRAVYPYYCGLDEKQLWKIRNLFVAGGINVPQKRVAVDPNKVVGKTIGISLEDDEYEGREKSKIASVLPLSEMGPAPAKNRVVNEEPPDDEDYEEDEEEPTPPPAPKKRAPRAKPVPVAEPEEDEEEDEEEPPPPPVRRKAKPAAPAPAPAPAKKAARKAAPPPVEEDEYEDDEDLDLDEL